MPIVRNDFEASKPVAKASPKLAISSIVFDSLKSTVIRTPVQPPPPAAQSMPAPVAFNIPAPATVKVASPKLKVAVKPPVLPSAMKVRSHNVIQCKVLKIALQPAQDELAAPKPVANIAALKSAVEGVSGFLYTLFVLH